MDGKEPAAVADRSGWNEVTPYMVLTLIGAIIRYVACCMCAAGQ